MDYVRLHARLRPGKTAVRDLAQERQWTYAEFDELIARTASLLLDAGVGQGDRVACLSKNRAEIIALHLACARLGAIFVPLNWRLSAAEIGQLLENSAPSLFFVDATGEQLQTAVETRDIDDLLADSDGQPAYQGLSPSPDLPSLMLYTSGTTGVPKGALLSERNITETAINFGVLGEVSLESGSLCESPMFHIIGLITSVRPTLLQGGHLVISDGFIPERTLDRLADDELKLTHYFCVPQMALAMRQTENFDPAALKNLKALFTGGAPHPEAQIRDWLNDGIPIVDGYGSSEAGTVFGMPLDLDIIDRKAGSVGVPTPRISARIVDASGQLAATGESGELQLKGDNVTSGYWQREEATRDAFTEDGWFCTGDIVTVDDEGFYRIVDRKKDMFISGGENVYPAEIESLLVKYPGIKEQSVVGVPDEKWGEVGCVFYVSASTTLSIEDIAGFLGDKLARYKIPKHCIKVDEIPRNGAGKVLKPKLKLLFAERG